MKIALVTGSGGLVGGEAVEFFSGKFDLVVGIDNDMRKLFFGQNASTAWNTKRLSENIPNYKHFDLDIRDNKELERIFGLYRDDIKLIIHTAAQPSHDWAVKEPFTDFAINANGTHNLLENTRKFCPDAAFIYTSTNKVYGDRPNTLPLVEQEERWEVENSHPYAAQGIDESMGIDRSTHSLFGVSKLAADLLVQEYGRYFGIKTGIFRCGCITGPGHSGAMLHGFLSYLMKCAVTGEMYTILGYKGKQVRDNIHSFDLVNMFWHFYREPHTAEVYNAGGSRYSNCSLTEAIRLCEEISGRKMSVKYEDQARKGDHIWYISDISHFREHYPAWEYRYGLLEILKEIYQVQVTKLAGI